MLPPALPESSIIIIELSGILPTIWWRIWQHAATWSLLKDQEFGCSGKGSPSFMAKLIWRLCMNQLCMYILFKVDMSMIYGHTFLTWSWKTHRNVGRKPDSVWECKVQSAYVFKKIQSPGQHAQFHTRNWLTVLKRPFLSNTMLMGVHVNMRSMSNMWLVLSSNHNLQIFSSGKFNKYN